MPDTANMLMSLLRSPFEATPGYGRGIHLKPWLAPLYPIMSPGPWSVLAAGEECTSLDYIIQLENKYILNLHDFPPLAEVSQLQFPLAPTMSTGSHSSLPPWSVSVT